MPEGRKRMLSPFLYCLRPSKKYYCFFIAFFKKMLYTRNKRLFKNFVLAGEVAAPCTCKSAIAGVMPILRPHFAFVATYKRC